MSYHKRLLFLAGLDSIIVLSAIYLSYIPLHPSLETFSYEHLFLSAIVLVSSYHLFASFLQLYNKAWEYASIGELVGIFRAVTLAILTVAMFQFAFNVPFYGRVLFSAWSVLILTIGGSRFLWRVYRDRYIKPDDNTKRVLIVGAGQAGTLLARQLKNNPELGMVTAAFIDDDSRKFKLQVLGIPVAGTSKNIVEAVEKYRIDRIVIAIPSLKKEELNRIFAECAKTNIKTQIMPKIEDVMLGKVAVSQFRDVEVEDLLGREPIKLDIEGISEYVSGKTVLVTGAGGSIGSEICRQICQFNPGKLVLVGHGENSIYTIDMELRNQYGQAIEIIPVIGDVQDRDRMFEVMEEHKPDVVYHAAAHKHVPLMEYNPREAVKNNVFGTKNVAEAADTFGVGTFVLVSTDKAVNPTNVMGSTKRIAEMIIQKLDQHSKTKFVAVRFGNVLGSRGSVIPLFKKQIQAGGPVTVTHPDMTRYFMTIPEASRLVIQAGSLARGGEIFVLDMGEPVKITDLAKNLIRLSGYTIEEIGIRYSGLRPGEKMFEELLNEKEIHPEPIFPKIFIGKAVLDQEEEISYLLERYENFTSPQLKEYVINLANRKKNKIFLVAK
ncbi:polysaccharide biosynthesis protein [Mesobacillus selenatarsenatis]|uniref:UDP-N-acetylglucosamine 4,6-dehydratase n=1 Tax=Mesobacillus selenatarsenatis (strain DSM 18680 / JCM 14380 / FERM P-15431 / SF-1) TaxID=1321606 RepID=A0A0A8XB11_MESS1|nr:nucleoside-diphosphate sugar epimerase/dehydratase [Mesobacillus selenatarsenatis]GAM16227.1 UDP-N-acetylglucosamine 4,6-dehydratase [Mesobacillus selenatarsenatis SF-1]